MKKYLIILKEFGVLWAFRRFIYKMKLSFLRLIPKADFLFERKTNIKRIDIFDFDVDKIERFLLELSTSEQSKIINSADEALIGKIVGFSSVELNYGNPINWHLNPFTKKEHDKNKKWFEIPDFDSEVGDIKIIWEISRLTHFINFARAYMITKDIKYYEGFIFQLEDWLKNNNYSYGANYKCGQEATIRMVNVLIAFAVFDSYGLVKDEDEALVKSLVENSYKKVNSNFYYAYKCIKNNHTFTEILGKIIGSWAEQDNTKLSSSMKLMDDEIDFQITKDGGFTQYSNNYHRFVLQILSIVLKIEGKLGMELKNKNKIYKSNLVLFNMMSNDGYVPNYGSNDGALIFPLSNADFRDFRPTVGAVNALLKSERIFPKGLHDEEIYWLTNSTLNFNVEELVPLKLPDIGQYSFRDANTFLLIHLNSLKYRPAHMDQLHFDLWHKNIEVFGDLGTYSYASKLGYELSLNYNHNTVYVPGKLQMNKTGAFMTYNRTILDDVVYYPNKYFKGSFYSRNGYYHERSIKKSNNIFEIIDKSNEKEFYLIFNTALDVDVDINKLNLKYNGKNMAQLIVNKDNEINVRKQYQSLYYLKKELINQIIIKVKKGEAKTTIVLVGDTND